MRYFKCLYLLHSSIRRKKSISVGSWWIFLLLFFSFPALFDLDWIPFFSHRYFTWFDIDKRRTRARPVDDPLDIFDSKTFFSAEKECRLMVSILVFLSLERFIRILDARVSYCRWSTNKTERKRETDKDRHRDRDINGAPALWSSSRENTD